MCFLKRELKLKDDISFSIDNSYVYKSKQNIKIICIKIKRIEKLKQFMLKNLKNKIFFFLKTQNNGFYLYLSLFLKNLIFYI